jgi:hypothetical protein
MQVRAGGWRPACLPRPPALELTNIQGRREKNRLGNAVGDTLPQATGMASSPMPTIAAILMLSSKQAKSRTTAVFFVFLVLGTRLVGTKLGGVIG